jgi:uncharacterized protein YggE
MKTRKMALCLSAFLLIINGLYAQTTPNMNPERKTIEVTGSAEIEVIPDEIYFSIALKEYFQDEKAQKNKVTIDALEKQLVTAITEAGLKKEDLSIGSMGGYKNWYGRKKPQLFLEEKQYVLKLANLYKLDNIMSRLDERGTQYANISRVEHSKIKEFKKEIKIKALQAAKDKATYLIEGIGEKLGEALEIKEVDEGNYYPQPQMMMRANAAMMDAAAPAPDSNIDIQKIKISYKMYALFRIK